MDKQEQYIDRIMRVRLQLLNHAEWLSNFDTWMDLSELSEMVETAADQVDDFKDLAQNLEDIVGEMTIEFAGTTVEEKEQEKDRPLYGTEALNSLSDRIDMLERQIALLHGSHL